MTIFIMDEHSSNSIKDLKILFEDLCLIHEKEKKLRQNLDTTISELFFLKEQFLKRFTEIKENGTSELDHYLKEINEIKIEEPISVELLDIILTTQLKSFLVFVKSSLDKMVLMFNYRYINNKQKNFEAKGNKLKTFISNKYSGKNRRELVELIISNKNEWMDYALKLRDEFTHFSKLNEYKGFEIQLQSDNSHIRGIEDFNVPKITLENGSQNANEYIDFVYEKLIGFISEFLKLTGFQEYHKLSFPKTCRRCKSDLIKPGNEAIVLNRKHMHGKLRCVKCNEIYEGYIGDLKLMKS